MTSLASSNTVQFTVGNTYQRLPDYDAPWDREGRFRKVHDWILYVDVLPGSDVDLVDRVTFHLGYTFDPPQFICHSPTKHGDNLRFSTRQQTYGTVTATIKIQGRGGTVQEIEYHITTHDNMLPGSYEFTESRATVPLRMVKLRDDVNFGIELELTSATELTPDSIALQLSSNQVGTVEAIDNYRAGRPTSSNWKIMPDSSIVCNRTLPDCNKFELVSPVLQGGHGLQQINSICKALNTSYPPPTIKVNKSMGFHVHIDVSGYTNAQLVKICQNFIKYEDAMDSFMPLSRRTGSEESNRYFQSNRLSVSSYGSNKQRHEALARTSHIDELAGLMNSENSRYYKLNLQNLVTNRQPTIEFRQHSATVNYSKIAAWIRFCVAFCANSARLAPPSPFAPGRTLDFQLDALFQYVIKDRALAAYFRQRQEDLLYSQEEDEACCSGCANGGGCSQKRQKFH